MRKLIFSALLCSAVALASPITKVTLTGVPAHDPTVGWPAVDVSPYNLSVNGQTVAALCIDFQDQTNVGDSWNAYLSTVGGDISNTYHPFDTHQYEEEAYIFTQITKPGILAADQIAWQEAAWAIMDRNYSNDPSYGPNDAARQDMKDAKANYSSVDFSDFLIVSSAGCSREQEFLIVDPAAAPEPASYALFGTGLLVAGAWRFLRKRSS